MVVWELEFFESIDILRRKFIGFVTLVLNSEVSKLFHFEIFEVFSYQAFRVLDC